MDQWHTQEELEEVMEKFMVKLVDSGYDTSTREEIIKSGLRRPHWRVNRYTGLELR